MTGPAQRASRTASRRRRLLAFLDESGSFELKDGRVDGMGLLLVPADETILRSIRVQVEWIEAIAGPEERVRGEVKGSHLRVDRYPALTRFLADHDLRFSPLAGQQRRRAKRGPDLILPASRVASVAKTLGVEKRGIEIALALLRIADSPRYYCSFAHHLLKLGALADLQSGEIDHVEVICDERLNQHDSLTLGVAIGVAMAETLRTPPGDLLEGLLGLRELPWTVRAGESMDRHGLQLTDWLLYPQIVVHRHDTADAHRARYEAVCRDLERAGVVIYPLDEDLTATPPPG